MKVIGIFVVLVFVCSGVFAVSGVSPMSYEVDFEQGYSGEFAFDFVLDGDADLYVAGELAEYVSLDKSKISGREKVVAILNLPSVIESPGVNQIFVGAKGDGFDVRGAIKVIVPYPERYVGLELNAPDVNVGEEVEINLIMSNLGSQAVDVEPSIEVYRGEELVQDFNGEMKMIDISQGLIFGVSFGSLNYPAGDYLAIAVVDYDNESVSVENSFRLGEFSVELVNYTRSFRENKVDRFEILVESFWNNDMVNVYADVNIVNFPLASFVTASESLSAWENQTLVGFLDVSKVEGEVFEAEIVLHYDGGNVSEIVRLNVIEGFDYVFWIVLLVTIVILVFLVWRGLIFVQRFKKHKIRKA